MVDKTLTDPEQRGPERNSLTRMAHRMGLDLGTLAVMIGLALTSVA